MASIYQSPSAAFAAATTLVRSIATKLIAFLDSAFPSQSKLMIAEQSSFPYVFQAAEIYLRTKTAINTTTQEIADEFQTVPLRWRLISTIENNNRRFELTFPSKFRTLILDSYIPYFVVAAEEEKIVEIRSDFGVSTFDSLLMDPALKGGIIRDLDLFAGQRDLYRKMEKPWRRSYLLSCVYDGPEIIYAMANHLKFEVCYFHIFDIYRNSKLKRVMSSASDAPILLFVDIDCDVRPRVASQYTLSGMLNLIRALWSSCGDNRIIIFTKDPQKSCLHLDWIDIHIYHTRLIKIFDEKPWKLGQGI